MVNNIKIQLNYYFNVIKVYNGTDFVDIFSNIDYTTISNDVAISINPFRYRGYYYDTETGFYYLNSRYYDPKIGRFINADDISVLDLTNIAINGLNLYAYCLNNPVNDVDEDGYIIWFFVAIAAFALLGGIGGTLSQCFTKGWNNINWGVVGFDALMSGLTGLLVASGVGAVGLAVGATQT